MKILKNTQNKEININLQTDFEIDLNKEDSLKQFENETLRKIINPVENYETNRFSHLSYSGVTDNMNDLVSDIWYQFHFYNKTTENYVGGLDYSLADITYSENSSFHKKIVNSFFRLEFYKVEENELPESSNRKLVMTKNLPIVSGERVFYTQTNDFIFVPVFMGEIFKHNENSFLYWFQTNDVFSESILSGNIFYMTAKFFNSGNGNITNFLNKNIIGNEVDTTNDFYYKVTLNNDTYTYHVSNMNGDTCGRIGNPIIFFETPN